MKKLLLLLISMLLLMISGLSSTGAGITIGYVPLEQLILKDKISLLADENFNEGMVTFGAVGHVKVSPIFNIGGEMFYGEKNFNDSKYLLKYEAFKMGLDIDLWLVEFDAGISFGNYFEMLEDNDSYIEHKKFVVSPFAIGYVRVANFLRLFAQGRINVDPYKIENSLETGNYFEMVENYNVSFGILIGK